MVLDTSLVRLLNSMLSANLAILNTPGNSLEMASPSPSMASAFTVVVAVKLQSIPLIVTWNASSIEIAEGMKISWVS